MGKVSVYGKGVHVLHKKNPRHLLHTLPEMVCGVFNAFFFFFLNTLLKLKVHFKVAFLPLAVAVSGKACLNCLNFTLCCWNPVGCWNGQHGFIVPAKRSRSCCLSRRTWHTGHNTYSEKSA